MDHPKLIAVATKAPYSFLAMSTTNSTLNPRIASLLNDVYGDDAPETELAEIIEDYRRLLGGKGGAASRDPGRNQAGAASTPKAEHDFPLRESDSILITYGDTFRVEGEEPLKTLYNFLGDDADGVVSGVHILPFSPYSSDDGFSVIDYRQVDPDLGAWKDIERISSDFVLMADLVINHCSQKSRWFQGFLADEEPYTRYFITVHKGADVSGVARPRTHPLLTPFETESGTKLVWTTFSADQVDLNFAEPKVFLEMVDVLLTYVAKGAWVIRLDAIAYLWKELGTACIHHPKTHMVVKLLAGILHEVAPAAIIITETNVPHAENVSYFGGGDEAQMVYNFSLPPLLLDAVLRGDTGHLTEWAAGLDKTPSGTTFFNFTASHDGVGLLPARGYLSDREQSDLVETVQARGGRVSYKATAGGRIPYELNINYLSAVTDPALPDAQRSRVFLATQAIMLALKGVPGIYIHSFIGSTNWTSGVETLGINRAINREKLNYDEVSSQLADEESLRGMVFEGYKRLLRARAANDAFHPTSTQHVLDLGPSVFALERVSKDGRRAVLCLHSLGADPAEIHIPTGTLHVGDTRVFAELTTGDRFVPTWEDDGSISLELGAYEVLWLSYPTTRER